MFSAIIKEYKKQEKLFKLGIFKKNISYKQGSSVDYQIVAIQGFTVNTLENDLVFQQN